MRRLVLAAVILSSTSARADLADVRISEVSPGAAGEPNTAYVELAVPASGACFFPTTRLQVFAADGTGLGASPLVDTATCVDGPAWLLYTSPDGAIRWGVGRDGGLTLAPPPVDGQLCLVSSATRYDCVRWGTVAIAIADFDSPSDTTTAPRLAGDASLSRASDTGVVASDFALVTPTPRAPNDGSPWIPPDASLLPDAMPAPDALELDAAPRPDAAPLPDAARPDARTTPAWLLADPGGGGCRVARGVGSRPRGPWLVGLLVAGACLVARAARTRRISR